MTHTAPRSNPPAAPPDDHLLRRDVRTLGLELGHVLKRHGGTDLYPLVERVRSLAKDRRTGDAEASAALRTLIAELSLEQLDELIRALACFFDLANLAEDRHRIRVLRDRERQRYPRPRKESAADAVASFSGDLDADAIQQLLQAMRIELVFTAHPTEAKRRTVRTTLRRLREDLTVTDDRRLLPRERQRLIESIRTDLGCLWETDALRPTKPTVIEEVRRGIYVAEQLWPVIPELYRGLRAALREHYPDAPIELPVFLRFGSWMGGDRDGNPFVTANVTRQTLTLLRNAALDLHRRACRDLLSVLSISERRHAVSAELESALDDARQRYPDINAYLDTVNPHEKYRHWLRVIRFRLQRTIESDPLDQHQPGAYRRSDELAADLRLIADSLRQNDHVELADGDVQDWLDDIAVFGFHLAQLDMREDSRRLHEAVAELMQQVGVADDYAEADETGKQILLSAPLTKDIPPFADSGSGVEELPGLSDAARETLALFDLLQRCHDAGRGPALGAFVISMTHQPSDVLAVLWLGRLATARAGEGAMAFPMPIAPLFETIDDLARADAILEDLLNVEAYADHVARCDGLQMCMVGYSDSTKDGGYLVSNWMLFDAQRRLAQSAKRHGLKLMIFHGRGGALGRGGGPAARGIMSLPADSVNGRIRITEQGEVLAERYDDPQIALRHLEQVTWATMRVTAGGGTTLEPDWLECIDRAATASMEHYRALVTDSGFVEYFAQATPIDTIETLPIGSRPSRRRGERKLDNLRAIPYTFAWTQNRHMLTGFYGLGTGLSRIAGEAGEADGDWSPWREMYERWSFFKAVIDNAELALAKADLTIGAHYARLLPDQEVGQRILGMIRDEYHRSRAAVLAITGRNELLDGTPWLQRSIRERNPYVDPLNLIQVELMRRATAPNSSDHDALQDLLRLSVQGIAAGLRTTG